MFLVSYEFTFDAGMRLLLLLLQRHQQHLVAQHCKKWCCSIAWHNALQDLPAKHLRMVKIKRSIKYRHLQFLTCALLALHNCTVAHAQNNNNFLGIALKIDAGGDHKHTILLQWPYVM